MQGVTGSLSIPEWILILAVPATVIGIFGYRWIHRVMQATAVIVGISILVSCSSRAAVRVAARPSETTLPAPTLGLFLAGVALLVIDMLSFGPFVSDYTRYLPADTNGQRLFWAIYAGNVLATIDPGLLGRRLPGRAAARRSTAVAADRRQDLRQVGARHHGAEPDQLEHASTATPARSRYWRFGNMWRRFKSASVMLRVVPFMAVMAVGAVDRLPRLPARSSPTCPTSCDVLLAVFIPWSAVNLTDYFLVRRGNYDVASFFIPDGIYGRVAWRGLLAYAIGLAAEWPFVSQLDYTGPLVKYLGGADISWIVGFFVAAIIYLVLVVTSRSETGRHDRQMAPAGGRW